MAEVGLYECQVSGSLSARYGFGIRYIESKSNSTCTVHIPPWSLLSQHGTRSRHGYNFPVYVPTEKDLPVIKYSKDKEVDFDEPVTLSCGLIKQGNKFIVKLVSIAWLKGSKMIQKIKHPDGNEKLKNISLPMESPGDAGTYKCQLPTILKLQREYTITGTIHVKGECRDNSRSTLGKNVCACVYINTFS